MFRTKYFSSRKKIYWRYGPYMASRNCLYYSPFKWNPWSVNIMTLCDFISIWVSPPPSFSCIFILRTKHFSSRKKSIGDMVHRWLLKTAYTILLSNETLDQSISCLCDDFLASEWAFPPSFSCIFIFRTIHFSSRKKIYWRYGAYMDSRNCLYYCSFKRNPWSINIISL